MDSIYGYLVICLVGLLNIIVLFKVLIPFFRRLKFGQIIRKEGPRNHNLKNGTPTMGGAVIIIGTIYLSLTMFLFNYYEGLKIGTLLLLYLPFASFGIIGFIDDYLIMLKKENEGLKPGLKFMLQLIVSVICYSLIIELRHSNDLNFFGYSIDIKFFYGIFIVLCFTGFSNATNLTDGLDGLLGGSSLIVILGILLLAIAKQNQSVIYFATSLIISIAAFLIFNLPKASIFMGDTGSLAIGAAIFSMLMMLNMDLLIFVFGLVYLIETISVILQVWFFKKTPGKRLFKMAPIHHHLELNGLNEIEIDLIFWIISLLITLVGYALGVLVF